MAINAQIIQEQPDNIILYKLQSQHPEKDNRTTKKGQYYNNNKTPQPGNILIGPTDKLCSNKYNRIHNF